MENKPLPSPSQNDSQRVGCGSHQANADGSPAFDYTCDDCMLPEPHLDHPEL